MQTQLTNQKYLKERLNFFLTETTKKTPQSQIDQWIKDVKKFIS